MAEGEEPTDEAALFADIGAGNGKDVRRRLEERPELLTATNEHGLTTLLWALYNRRPDIAELLCDAGYAPDPFESAALGDRAGVERALEEDGARIDGQSRDGFTLLHLACYFGHERLVDWLLERGSDPNVAAGNPSGVAPLHSAAASRKASIVVRLLDAGAVPDATQQGGFTALMSAALHGDVEMAEALVGAGADPARIADDGRSARTMAAESDEPRLLEALEG